VNESFVPFQLDVLAWYERDGVHVVNDPLLLHVGGLLRFLLSLGSLDADLCVLRVQPYLGLLVCFLR